MEKRLNYVRTLDHLMLIKRNENARFQLGTMLVTWTWNELKNKSFEHINTAINTKKLFYSI